MTFISVVNCSVKLPIYGTNNRSMKGVIMAAVTGGKVAPTSRNITVVDSLRDVSFELREGDKLGLVGHNGAGKTTLLKTLAGIYEPTFGYVRSQGRIANLLDVTMGMDFEATGLENVRLKGLLHGLSSHEIAKKIPGIVEFSGLGSYVAMPVRAYSSGMLVRLAFAIATSFDAEILLMDEWLGVGDADFNARAQQRLAHIVSQASILVLASHNQDIISANCNRIMHLEHGRVIADEMRN
ncbi:Teichoic acids export ATP-binding protein TagH [Xanthomonas sacchari]|uniref:Teichoic acids export ATP-binding protein TagH n=2 Tax=Xanthomonas TaxID=338 RepID=A0ABT3DW23_9XANT|nr:sugar ABC transporter ATP-binding protein [Xanthomonas sontii]MCW0399546.1 Teichoic acids export ATP-binding protein TagH [Xanthomonas sacchari]MCW0420204.1 Teichoic acids export ATP-binding protein TagH [Xanthomonas sacchari]MCW0453128.1 Teichoic acids export ATP-binding protein TagH [Xanthomonas sacchari]